MTNTSSTLLTRAPHLPDPYSDLHIELSLDPLGGAGDLGPPLVQKRVMRFTSKSSSERLFFNLAAVVQDSR